MEYDHLTPGRLIIHLLAMRRIHLSVVDDRLLVEADEPVDPELLEELRSRRDELIEWLDVVEVEDWAAMERVFALVDEVPGLMSELTWDDIAGLTGLRSMAMESGEIDRARAAIRRWESGWNDIIAIAKAERFLHLRED